MTKAFDNASMLASWLASAKNGRTIDSTAAATFSITLKNGGGNGDLISLNGTSSGGGTNGTKSLRVNAGNLEVLDSTYANILMRVTDAGVLSATTITQTSDERKKSHWHRVPADLIERLAGLRKAGIFRWKKSGQASVGVGAQSLEAILPEAVHTDEHGNKTVNYGGAAIVAAVELARKVVALEARLAKLEEK